MSIRILSNSKSKKEKDLLDPECSGHFRTRI